MWDVIFYSFCESKVSFINRPFCISDINLLVQHQAFSYLGRMFKWAAPVTLLMSFPALAQTYPGSGSVFVPYANASSNVGLTSPPTVSLGFNNETGHTSFVMDTGSTGIIASPDNFAPAVGAQNLGTGSQFYSSSGKMLNGTWYSSTENIYAGNGQLLATANVPVMQVQTVTCAVDARNCKPDSHPTNIGMMGIGFARESSQQLRATPGYNPFINITAIAAADGILHDLPGGWASGYVVTSSGTWLGLTSTNTANAAFAKLTQTTYPADGGGSIIDWAAATMSLNLNGVSGNGNMLMDTGVTVSYLSPPPGASAGALVACSDTGLVECLSTGSTVSVSMPGLTDPIAYYTYNVGQVDNPMQPDEVVIAKDTSGVFLNTSAHFLNGMNLIFDPTNGYVGYQWTGNTPSNDGFVTPVPVPAQTGLVILGSFGLLLTQIRRRAAELPASVKAH